MQYTSRSGGARYPDVRKTAEYICQEIRNNAKSADVQSLKRLNQAIYLSLDAVMIMGDIAKKVAAYVRWYKLVSSSSKWDHKSAIRALQHHGDWACDRTTRLKFNFDIWSNIHYGFVGKCAGFTEFELTNGAGLAQVLDNGIDGCIQNYGSNRDGGIIGAFDDPCDTHAVQVGYRLYDKFKDDSSKLTVNDVLNELYSFYENGKVLHIESCGFKCGSIF